MKPSRTMTPNHGEPKLVPVQDTEVNPVVPQGDPFPLADEPPTPPSPKSDLDAVQELADAHDQILAEIEKRIIGQKRVIEQLLVALFALGHTLFVGVPGLAKSLLI